MSQPVIQEIASLVLDAKQNLPLRVGIDNNDFTHPRIISHGAKTHF